MPKIKFIRENKTIEVPSGSILRKVALENAIQVNPGPNKYLNCLGNGTCGTCAVHIKKGFANCSPVGLMEGVRLSVTPFSIGHEQEMRLSCQTRVLGDIEVETQPEWNLHGEKFWG